MISIDVVIPCAGRAADLMRLLESIHMQCAASLSTLCASITVSDDRYSAQLGRQVSEAHPSVRYVSGPSRGPAANRNHGSAQGSAPWILFLDDDCYLVNDALQAYAGRILANAKIDVLEGAIHAVGARPNGNHHAPLNLDGGQLWSCNLLVRRAAFAAVGGFDEDFPFACLEDSDLHDRLRFHGAVIQFADDAVVLHPWRSISEKEVSRQIISHAIYAQKHPEFARRFDLLHLLRALRARLRQYRTGSFASIPRAKYRTVGFDFLAPLAVYAVVRWPLLRRALSDRYRNRPAQLV